MPPNGTTAGNDAATTGTSEVSWFVKAKSAIMDELNFFRVHLLVFITVPLIFSGIVYAANTEYKISYTDCLFLTVSAMTTTGLATVDLSTLNPFQQACLMLLFFSGSLCSVSAVILIVRQFFLRQGLKSALASLHQGPSMGDAEATEGEGVREVAHAGSREFGRSLTVPVTNTFSSSAPSYELPDLKRAITTVDNPNPTRQSPGTALPRTFTLSATESRRTKYSGFGGFPMPLEALRTIGERYLPALTERVVGPAPGPTTQDREAAERLDQAAQPEEDDEAREEREHAALVEYRASRLLLVIVLCYISITPILAYVISAPYLTVGEPYAEFFENQHRRVATPWFALFNVWSSFTNCGLSLSDTSMIPFQSAHVFVLVTVFLILMGNTCYPILLRAIVWTLYRIVPGSSRHSASLRFLLDHPRRCFLYLFPAKQTWYLAAVVFTLTSIDFVAFLVLDIGNSVIESIPVGTRILAALMQAAAVRVEGFAIVPLAALVPAVQVLFVVMMYTAVLPLALTVRASNVYEEQSLGVYRADEWDEHTSAPKAVSGYVRWHAKRQLAFDIWWLALALWIVCIIERDNLTDTTKTSWFNIFSILFEIVSAYGTVGLSLGCPLNNYSFAGNMHVLSKLVIMAVMLRGRHRSLPDAIDRAVMLPSELEGGRHRPADDRVSTMRGSMRARTITIER